MIAAIIPAAGKSRRMGQPKLLLQHSGRTILSGVILALKDGGADPVIVVAPPELEPEGPLLADAALKAGAEVIAPAIRPTEMRESIEVGLSALAGDHPVAPEAVLIAPADIPGISASLVRRLIGQRRTDSSSTIIIPCFEGKRGHPILLNWETALQIRELPPDVGLNALVYQETAAGRVTEMDVADSSALLDIDTPEDWAIWQCQQDSPRRSSSNRQRVHVRLFALARHRAGVPEIVVEISEQGTVEDLKQAIADSFPMLADLLPNVLIAVNSEYASDDLGIPENAQVAVIPPVSGGAFETIRNGVES